MITLPTNGIKDASPYFMDFGGILAATLGGADQRLNRFGSRWGCEFTTKPMKGEEARIWVARLIRGVHEKAEIAFPQPGVALPPNFATYQASLANATLIGLNGNQSLYKEGMFFQILLGNGVGYIHQMKANASDNPGSPGTASLAQIQPPLRTAIPHGTQVNWTSAKIQGYVKGDRQGWNIDDAKIYGLNFRIEEAE